MKTALAIAGRLTLVAVLTVILMIAAMALDWAGIGKAYVLVYVAFFGGVFWAFKVLMRKGGGKEG